MSPAAVSVLSATSVIVVGLVLGITVALLRKARGDAGMLPGLERWKPGSLPITVVVNVAHPELTRRLNDAVEWAIQFWGDQVGWFLFVPYGDVGMGAVVPVSMEFGEWGDGEHTIAEVRLTHRVANDRTRYQATEIQSAAVYLNNTNAPRASDATLKRAIAHELGHVLGLAHDLDPDSIMFHKAAEGGFAVTAADKELLRALYEDDPNV